MKKRFIAAALAVFCLSGCSQSAKLPKGASENEILTLAAVKQDKELVTIHFEYGFGNSSTFESAIEKNFPNVDIIMVHDGATDSTSLLEGNLKNGTECDIILSRVLQILKNRRTTYSIYSPRALSTTTSSPPWKPVSPQTAVFTICPVLQTCTA